MNMLEKYDGLLVCCFGTANQQLFDQSFKKIFNQLSSHFSGESVLAITNDHFAHKLNECTMQQALEKIKDCQSVIAIGLFMADGTQYQSFKSLCESRGYDFNVPLLQLCQKELAEEINNHFPFKENSRTLFLAHGSELFDNHEYFQLLELLRDDFSLCFSDTDPSLSQVVMDSKEEILTLSCLMFSCGHHFQHEKQQFEMLCEKMNKKYEINEIAIGQTEWFIQCLLDKINFGESNL